MSDIVSSDELNTLAAEFVLGTLDYDERKGATALLEVDHAFRGIVRIWERRLGDLHLMVEAVEPDPQLWTRIRPKIGGVEQIELAIPSHVAAHAMESETSTMAAVDEGRRHDDARPPESLADLPPAAGPFVAAPAVAAAVDEPPAEASPPMLTDRAPAEEAPPASEMPASAETVTEAPTETTAAIEARSALADAELRLAELAALLPPAGRQDETFASDAPASASEPPPETPAAVVVDEELLQPREPEPDTRGFVPPPPMMTRNMPVAMEPVRRAGRGWVVATLLMGVVTIALAGLIGAWRYFPDRLPQPLAIDSVLNQHAPAAPPPAKPLPPPFEE